MAAHAGVSIATVSRILNQPEYVSSAREEVVRAAAELAYLPSQRARGLRRSCTMTLGVLVPELANPVNLEFLRGVEQSAQSRGYVVLVSDSQRSAELERRILQRLFEERIDGLVVGGVVSARNALSLFVDNGIPIAPSPGTEAQSFNRAWERAEGEATRAMADRLLQLGHTSVALFLPALAADAGRPGRFRRSRISVLASKLHGAGASLEVVQVDPSDRKGSCREAVRRLLASKQQPTVFVAGSHVLAPALLMGIDAAGLRLPTDASFVTYGDSDWAVVHKPALSVVHHDVLAEARFLTDRLLDTIEGVPGRIDPPLVEAAFVERASTGQARLFSRHMSTPRGDARGS